MKVRARRYRRRNNSAQQRRRRNNNHEENPLEVKENAPNVEANSSNLEGNASACENNPTAAGVAAVIPEAGHAGDEPKNENNTNEIAHPVQAAPASDDEDSGTENDRNDEGAITDDEDSEAEKESYQVEVARTMRDIVHTRDMLFSLTRRVDQLLEFCKILQTKQNQQQQQNQQEHQSPDQAARNSFE